MTMSAERRDSPSYDAPPRRVGFFTDTTLCIGCKACEVACKEWNGVPETPFSLTGHSFDNTGALGANAWRHVAFIEQRVSTGGSSTSDGDAAGGDGMRAAGELRWLMSSDVCKHCTQAACLEVCPTGSLFRTEFGTVVVQADICNGCGYCIPACPFGVIDQRKEDGRAFKCTLCYDRLRGGLEPACAKACPTESIQFGALDELRQRAEDRLARVQARGEVGARLYGADPDDGVSGAACFFLLLDDPEVYGLPPDPVASGRHLRTMWSAAAAAAGTAVALVATAVLGGRR